MSISFEELKREDCRIVARRLGLELNRQDKVRCFLHAGDKNPSLKVYANGWKCFGCDEHGDAVDLISKYLGISNIEAVEWMKKEFNIQEPPRKQDYGQAEREHIYPGGQVKKVMYRRADGSKYGIWFHLENGAWKKGRGNAPHSLYIAGQLTGAVFVVEGEKDCDTLHKLGYDAVSGEDGAGPGKWRPEYTEQLKGLPVVIFQDNDQTGKDYAQETAAALHGVASSVQVLDLTQVWPNMPEKGDISDLVAKFGAEKSCDMIAKLISTTAQWEPEKEPDVFDSFGFYSVPDLTEEERRPPEFIIDGMIPCGMTFLSGAPKIRKTFMALQMAISVASGQPFLGHNTTKCDVAYLDLEGSKSRVSFRTDRMTTKIPRNVYITNTITERLADGLVDKLRQLHQSRPSIRLIIIDTYSRARGTYKSFGVNAYDADVALLEPVQRMALDENIAVLFIHHDKKGAGFMSDSFERLSGTMGISGSADCVINLVADGKRFDGKATMEYTPRDAKGGEIKIVFDERFGEWQELIEEKPDLRGNPICNWIIQNAPERQKEGTTFSYSDVFKFSYGCYLDNPGNKVREQIEAHKDDLFLQFGIGVQIGVRSHGERGIRIINLL